MYFNLQPTGARRAFPCWDEPTIRATFDITLIVPKDRVALSNMVIKLKYTDYCNIIALNNIVLNNNSILMPCC